MKKLLLALGALTVAACTGIQEPAQLDGEKVHFAFDSAEISSEAEDNLLGQSLYMKNHPNEKVLIAGNCDERGSSEYNLALGALRAGNAAHVLMKDGIENSRIKTISYGKEKASACSDEDCWEMDRNATTHVK